MEGTNTSPDPKLSQQQSNEQPESVAGTSELAEASLCSKSGARPKVKQLSITPKSNGIIPPMPNPDVIRVDSKIDSLKSYYQPKPKESMSCSCVDTVSIGYDPDNIWGSKLYSRNSTILPCKSVSGVLDPSKSDPKLQIDGLKLSPNENGAYGVESSDMDTDQSRNDPYHSWRAAGAALRQLLAKSNGSSSSIKSVHPSHRENEQTDRDRHPLGSRRNAKKSSAMKDNVNVSYVSKHKNRTLFSDKRDVVENNVSHIRDKIKDIISAKNVTLKSVEKPQRRRNISRTDTQQQQWDCLSSSEISDVEAKPVKHKINPRTRRGKSVSLDKHLSQPVAKPTVSVRCSNYNDNHYHRDDQLNLSKFLPPDLPEPLRCRKNIVLCTLHQTPTSTSPPINCTSNSLNFSSRSAYNNIPNGGFVNTSSNALCPNNQTSSCSEILANTSDSIVLDGSNNGNDLLPFTVKDSINSYTSIDDSSFCVHEYNNMGNEFPSTNEHGVSYHTINSPTVSSNTSLSVSKKETDCDKFYSNKTLSNECISHEVSSKASLPTNPLSSLFTSQVFTKTATDYKRNESSHHLHEQISEPMSQNSSHECLSEYEDKESHTKDTDAAYNASSSCNNSLPDLLSSDNDSDVLFCVNNVQEKNNSSVDMASDPQFGDSDSGSWGGHTSAESLARNEFDTEYRHGNAEDSYRKYAGVAVHSDSNSSHSSESESDQDADDEFECDCPYCQISRHHEQASESPKEDENGMSGISEEERLLFSGSYQNIIDEDEDNLPFHLDPLNPLDFFLMRHGRRDLLEAMFQNVIMQMLAVYPELLGEQAPPPAPPSSIHQLPIISVQEHQMGPDFTCPICLCLFEVKEEINQLPCQHMFHTLCVQAWLTKSGTCPVCRYILPASKEANPDLQYDG